MNPFLFIRRLTVAACALAMVGAAGAATHAKAPVSSQAAAPPPDNGVTPADIAAGADIDHADIALQLTTAGLRARSIADADLKARVSDVASTEAKLNGAVTVLTPSEKDLDSRLAQLGAAPAPGQTPEDPDTAADRKALTLARANVDSEIKQARLLLVEADQLDRALDGRLRANFTARLWVRDRSMLSPALWWDFANAIPGDVRKATGALGAEAMVFGRAVTAARAIPTLVLAGLFTVLLLGPARIVLNRIAQKRAGDGAAASPLRKASLGLGLVLVAALTPLAAGEVLRGAFIDAHALTPTFIFITGLLIRVIVFAAVLEGLGRALLSPTRSAWRLAPMSDAAARRLAPWPVAVGVAVGLATFVGGLNTALDASLPSSIASICFVVLLEAFAVGGGLLALGGARADRAQDADLNASKGARAPWVIAALCAWAALAATLLAVLFGYLALAGFLMRETVWIATVLAVFFLVVRFTDELFPALLSPASPLGRAIEAAIGLSPAVREQVGVLLSGLARLGLLLMVWLAVLAPFGASADGLATSLTGASLTVHLGKATISPVAIAGAVALFVAGMLITRAIRGWFENRYLPKTQLDIGLRTSMAAGMTYLGALIAILVAFSYLGLSLSQIALFASALSVGIGFGLQAIIGNFVSGLILLAERPVQVGDWIAIGDLEGDVRRINIRATEIEMTDRSKLIVPNSDLVSKTVRNVTHGAAIGRVRIILRVDDGADPAMVRDLMLDRIKNHAEVLADPPPAVYLSDVKDGALEFTAFAYVPNPRIAFRVKSELLFEMVPGLKDKGVGLANNTPVVNVGVPDRLIEPAGGA